MSDLPDPYHEYMARHGAAMRSITPRMLDLMTLAAKVAALKGSGSRHRRPHSPREQ
jgi:hypothetical protein